LEETLIKAGFCNVVKGPSRGQGMLYFTSKRFFWIRDNTNTATAAGGLVGGLIASAANAKNTVSKDGFTIAIADIRSVKQVKAGLFGRALLISLNDGSEYSLSPRKFKNWTAELGKTMSIG
jgi:hypothetical protein